MAHTVVIQSWKSGPLPRWQERCIASVREWVEANGLEYRYVDDRLLEIVPAWYRERCGTQKLPVTDLGRLLLLKEALAEPGCERALWVDADVVVFDPGRLRVPEEGDYAFCLEYWQYRHPEKGMQCRRGANNSFIFMRRNSPMLPFYIDQCERIVADTAPRNLWHDSVGTRFLSRLAYTMPLPVVAHAGLFSPGLVIELAAGGEEYSRDYASGTRGAVACANLCGSMAGRPVWDSLMREQHLEAAVERLLSTRGEAINRFTAGT